MTQTNDPPTVLDIGLIPNSNEKADLNAPSDSGGKLVTGQAPNITITETTVVADAAERLALDVQEGDIAIQTNVSTSFIFTGGDNVAPNWESLDFDAVGAIDGEDINPSGVNGANINTATAGQSIESDGAGGLQFADPAGASVPTGGIIMWSGAIIDIPSGYALCDGTNGTPDLTDRFVVGAGGSEYSVNDTGGADNQTANITITDTANVELDASTSTITFSEQRVAINNEGRLISPSNDAGILQLQGGDTPSLGTSFGNTFALEVNVNASDSDTFDNRPAFYALAYIMKT